MRKDREGKGLCVKIECIGLNFSRLFRVMAERGITITKLKRVGSKCVHFYLSLSDYSTFLELEETKNYSVRVLSKRGWAWVFENIFRASGIVFGSVFAFILFFSSVNVIWNVSILGGGESHVCANGDRCIFQEANRSELEGYLESLGVYAGATKSNIFEAKSAIERAVVAKFEGVSACSIGVVGTKLEVKVFEGALENSSTNQGATFDLVAPENGIVQKLVVSAGVPAVKAGDVVTKGQVLVAGTNGKRAMASVHMTLIFEKSYIHSENVGVLEETGEEFVFSYLDVCGLKLGAKNAKAEELEKQGYQKEVKVTNICPNLFVPISKVMVKYKKLTNTIKRVELSSVLDEIVMKLSKELEDKAKVGKTENYKITTHTSELSDGLFEVDCYLEVQRIIKQ